MRNNRMFRLCGLAVMALGVAGSWGCDDNDSGGSLSKEGEDCWDDCESGLRCRNAVCIPSTASGDTTWTDSTSGLTWQDPPSGDFMTWKDAKAYCDNLILGGRDDWHLPTISELRSLIRGCDNTVTGGACGVTDDCLDSSCWKRERNTLCVCSGVEAPLAGPGTHGAYWPEGMSGEINTYWSSSPVADSEGDAWGVDFYYGFVFPCDKGNDVRCVR